MALLRSPWVSLHGANLRPYRAQLFRMLLSQRVSMPALQVAANSRGVAAVRAAAVCSKDGTTSSDHTEASASQAGPAVHDGVQTDYFFADSAASFRRLGLSAVLTEALRRAGFERPSRAQELAVPAILAGRDVVLAAETGSGKTLAYVGPLVDILLKRDAAHGEGPCEAQGRMAVVLCPNAELCSQVLSVVNALKGDDDRPLLRTYQVSSATPPPFDAPDVVAATPGALMTLLKEAGHYYGYMWTLEGFAARTVALVADEADLLLGGGYVRDLTRILDAMKVSERRHLEEQVVQELGLDKHAFERMPRSYKLAAWEAGAQGLIDAGYPAARRAAPLPQGGFGPYARKQYVFVAATMPNVTKADAGSELQRRFKAAEWIPGDLLHKSKPGVTHVWQEVDSEESWAQALIKAVLHDPDYQLGRARTLVFAADAAATEAISAVLTREAVPHGLYHKGLPALVRADALDKMRAPGTGNAVLVCTDAGARGLDLPAITHVVQADFSSTAVDFLHRIGRTARADRGGKVTSLYQSENAALARVIREYVEAGRPVEDCFSRRRSFSKKMKRYGKFVARGTTGM